MYETYLRQNIFKISTKLSAVAHVLPLWRHASLINHRNCSFTHLVVKGQERATEPISELMVYSTHPGQVCQSSHQGPSHGM